MERISTDGYMEALKERSEKNKESNEIFSMSELVKDKIGFTKKYSRLFWLGRIKRSGLNFYTLEKIIEKALALPKEYNRGGYVNNQL